MDDEKLCDSRYSRDELLALKESPLVSTPKDMPAMADLLGPVPVGAEEQRGTGRRHMQKPEDIVLGPTKTAFASANAQSFPRREESEKDRNAPENKTLGRRPTRDEPQDGWISVSRTANRQRSYGSEANERFGSGDRSARDKSVKYDHFGRERRGRERPREGFRERKDNLENGQQRKFKGNDVRPEWMDVSKESTQREPEIEKSIDGERKHSAQEFEAWRASMKAQDMQNDDTNSLTASMPKLSTVDDFGSLWTSKQPEDKPTVLDEEGNSAPKNSFSSRSSRFSNFFTAPVPAAPAVAPSQRSPDIIKPSSQPSTAPADKDGFQKIMALLQGPEEQEKRMAPPGLIPPTSASPGKVASPANSDPKSSIANQNFLLSLMNQRQPLDKAPSRVPHEQYNGSNTMENVRLPPLRPDSFRNGPAHPMHAPAPAPAPPPGMNFPPFGGAPPPGAYHYADPAQHLAPSYPPGFPHVGSSESSPASFARPNNPQFRGLYPNRALGDAQ